MIGSKGDLVEGIVAEATTKTVARVRVTRAGVGSGGGEGGMGASKSSLITPLSARLFQLIATPRAVLLSFYRAVLPAAPGWIERVASWNFKETTSPSPPNFLHLLEIICISDRRTDLKIGTNDTFILEIGTGRIM